MQRCWANMIHENCNKMSFPQWENGNVGSTWKKKWGQNIGGVRKRFIKIKKSPRVHVTYWILSEINNLLNISMHQFWWNYDLHVVWIEKPSELIFVPFGTWPRRLKERQGVQTSGPFTQCTIWSQKNLTFEDQIKNEARKLGDSKPRGIFIQTWCAWWEGRLGPPGSGAFANACDIARGVLAPEKAVSRWPRFGSTVHKLSVPQNTESLEAHCPGSSEVQHCLNIFQISLARISRHFW